MSLNGNGPESLIILSTTLIPYVLECDITKIIKTLKHSERILDNLQCALEVIERELDLENLAFRNKEQHISNPED